MTFHEVIWRVEFQDRVGVGMEVFRCLADHGVSVNSMDASVNNGMILRFTVDSSKYETLYEAVSRIDAVIQVSAEEYMPDKLQEHGMGTLLNLTEEGILVIDKTGRIVHINDRAARFLWLSKESALGEPIETIVEPQFPVVQALNSGTSLYRKEIRTTVRGSELHCVLSAQPVFDNEHGIIGAVGVFRPVKSARKVSITGVPNSIPIMFDDIVYTSRLMRRAVESAIAAAQTDATILLRGETGTGKEMFARAIHAESYRWNGPFVPINCSALPENLLESELFGYEEGTFTGALRDGKAGLFEKAQGGTLFLDEIGEISPSIQVRLLRVLQERAVRRIGSSEETPIDVRVISATHRNLEKMIDNGQFREDLYYRLNVIPLHIPPLRERKEDIYPLTVYLINKLSQRLHRDVVMIEPDAMEIITNQEWPGNVRQLENFVERLLVLVPTKQIRVQDIGHWLDNNPRSSLIETKNSSSGFHINLHFTAEWPSLREVEEEAERQLLMQVLHHFPSSRKAGQVLGVSNTTILNKMNKLNIETFG